MFQSSSSSQSGTVKLFTTVELEMNFSVCVHEKKKRKERKKEN